MSTEPTPSPWSGRHPSVAHFEQLFEYKHLADERLQRLSQRFAALAEALLVYCSDGPELSTALRKLVEAKDAAVRQAVIDLRSRGDRVGSNRPE